MKKFSLLLTLSIMMVSSAVFAGSLDYLSNQSAKFLLTFNRTASTDASADIANYNPAGTAFLVEGLYLDVSNQTLLKYYETTTDGSTEGLKALGFKEKYEQSEPTYILPNIYAVYNFGQMGPGKLAAYAQGGVSAGGGTLKWDDGTAATFGALSGIFKTQAVLGGASATTTAGKVTAQSFEASSVYYTINAGASYAFLNDMVSASLGGKIIMAKRSLKVSGAGIALNMATGTPIAAYSVEGEYDYDATGYTPVVGLDVKPMKDLTLAVRYEMETALKFKYDQKKLSGTASTAAGMVLGASGIKDGAKFNNNLPAIASIGAEYKVTPEFAVMASSQIYFLSKADMNGTENYFDNGYEMGLGATYMVMPTLKVGLGYMYTIQGTKDEYFKKESTFLNCAGNPPLDSNSFSLGTTYTVIPNLDITLSGSWTHYVAKSYKFTSSTGATMAGEYNKDVYNIGLGAGYKI